MSGLFKLGDFQPETPPDGDYWLAPGAIVLGRVRLHTGVSIWFNAVIRGDNDLIEIGENSNIQDGAVLHTDPGLKLSVGAGCTIGHKAILHGCAIGDGSLVGMGATVLNGARIGANSLVGANALVVENRTYPDGSLIVGAPAKAVRQLSEAEIAGLAASAASYRARMAAFRDDLRPLA